MECLILKIKIMKKIIVLLMLIISMFCISANSRNSGINREYAYVDTDPGTAGYWTNSINIRNVSSENIAFLSIRGSGVMTITLQFRCPGDATWTDYATYTTASTRRMLIEGAALNVLWRAGVKDTDYTSGNLTFGFDW